MRSFRSLLVGLTLAMVACAAPALAVPLDPLPSSVAASTIVCQPVHRQRWASNA